MLDLVLSVGEYGLPSLFILWLLLRPSARRWGRGGPVWYGGLLAAFALSMTAVFVLTGVSPMSGFHSDIRWEDVNLTPFVGILAFWESIGEPWAARNLLGNILLFVPLGALAPLIGPKGFGFLKTTVYGLSVSLLIECSQLFLIRGTDVDDLILNTAGTVLGYVLYLLFRGVFPGSYRSVAGHLPPGRTLLPPTACVLVPYLVVVAMGFCQRFLYLSNP